MNSHKQQSLLPPVKSCLSFIRFIRFSIELLPTISLLSGENLTLKRQKWPRLSLFFKKKIRISIKKLTIIYLMRRLSCTSCSPTTLHKFT